MPALFPTAQGVPAPVGTDRARRSLLVATDGGQDGIAALAMAGALASQASTDVQVLACMTPFDAVGELQSLRPEPDERWRARRDHLLQLVREQIRATLPESTRWPVTVVMGYGGEDIATFARSSRPDLILMGRGRHRFLERLSRGPEEVLRVLQLGDVPVLAVESGAHTPPQRIVVASDFSDYSSYAGRVALELAADDAVIFLAHVRPHERFPSVTVPPSALAYEEALPTRFAEARAALSLKAGQYLRTVELGGDPGTALRNFVVASKADLVVSATHGRGVVDRMLLGSVAADLLRHASCSFLCVPGAAFDRRFDIRAASLPLREGISTAELGEQLAQFTTRNAGRACFVELTRPGDAAQVLVHDRPFAHAAFDRARSALHLEIGTFVGPTAEHTQILSSIRGVDRLIGASGRDAGLIVDDGDAGWLRLEFTS